MTTPLDLVHIDFTSIEVSRDDNLHTTLTIVPVLVITDYFTRHSMAFVMKDQKASTVTKKLYENYICIFGAPARLHSDQGAISLVWSLLNYVPFWEYRNQKILHIAPRVMGKWNGCTKADQTRSN